MSDFKQYCDEKGKIDELVEKGYVISKVEETLSGAFVQFSRGENAAEIEELHILTADARKYFSNLLIAQKSKVAHHA